MEGQRISSPVGELIVRGGTSPMTARVRVLDAGYSKSSVQAWTKVVLRVLLGALFVFAGWQKLRDPQFFSFGIKGFKFGLADHLVINLTFMIPWTEILAGLCLIVGFWTRGAALIIAVMMIAFMLGFISIFWRELDVKCSCFGKLDKFLCGGGISTCHVIRNGIIAIIAGYLAKVGAGPFSLDRIRAKQHIRMLGYKPL